MKAGVRIAMGLVVVLWAAAAGAQSTDLKAIRTIVTDAPLCAGSPVQNQQACISVVVQNLGPDVYGGESAKPANPTAGALRVSVDIDEPTKPGLPGVDAGPFVQDFLVTLAPNDSIQLDFGPVGFVPASGGTHSAQLTVIALAPHTDPNPLNDQAVTVFNVVPVFPATGRTALVALAALLVGGAWLGARRLRSRPV
jgi:hypothetical protein